MIWFGLEEDQMDWTKRDDVEGDFSVFAETVSLEAINQSLTMQSRNQSLRSFSGRKRRLWDDPNLKPEILANINCACVANI